MRVTCPICQGPHAKWDCKAPESTAARKDVPSSQTGGSPVGIQGKDDCGGQKPQKQSLAGTQVLPVDINDSSGSIPAAVAELMSTAC